MHKQLTEITLERISDKCPPRPASYLIEMQEKSQFLMQDSCGFPWRSASELLPGHGLHVAPLSLRPAFHVLYLLCIAGAPNSFPLDP